MYRTPTAGARLRELMVSQPLTFQSELFAKLIERGLFHPADPTAVALAFWGPIVAILTSADTPDDEPAARQLLHVHLDHFRKTYAISPEES